MKHEVIDNFLSNEDFDIIQYLMTCPQVLPWYYNSGVSHVEDGDGYFTHLFYDKYKPNSDNFHVFSPFIEKLKIKSLIRIKGNMYMKTPKLHIHKGHKDFDYDHKAAIFYVNDCNGYTILNDKTKIESKKNRILIFDPQVIHSSTTCTDQPFRVNINFNYF
jgi:hypothetical protein